MRISDWSSDVCSSDLAAGRVDHQGGADAVAVTDIAAQRLDQDLVVERLQHVMGGAERESALRVVHHGGHDHRDRRQLRSEEHTSELQSLMRNSYAALCLKKKTYNIQYNPNAQRKI